METQIEVKGAEFIEKGFKDRVNTVLGRHERMINEITEFIVGVKEKFLTIEEILSEIKENQKAMDDKISALQNHMASTQGQVLVISEIQDKKWKEHKEFHENSKGILASVFGKWKEK